MTPTHKSRMQTYHGRIALKIKLLLREHFVLPLVEAASFHPDGSITVLWVQDAERKAR